jgi:RES domain-containing protein
MEESKAAGYRKQKQRNIGNRSSGMEETKAAGWRKQKQRDIGNKSSGIGETKAAGRGNEKQRDAVYLLRSGSSVISIFKKRFGSCRQKAEVVRKSCVV